MQFIFKCFVFLCRGKKRISNGHDVEGISSLLRVEHFYFIAEVAITQIASVAR